MTCIRSCARTVYNLFTYEDVDPHNVEEENEEVYDTITPTDTLVNNDNNDGSQMRNRRQGVPPRYEGEHESQNQEYDTIEDSRECVTEPDSTDENREDTRELGIVGMIVYSDDNNAQHNSSNNEGKANVTDSLNEEAGDGQVDQKIYDSAAFNTTPGNCSNSGNLNERIQGERSVYDSCDGKVGMKDYTEMESLHEGIEAKKSEGENEYEALQHESSATADQVRPYTEIILEENANADENQSLVQIAVFNNNENNDYSDCTYDENKSDYV